MSATIDQQFVEYIVKSLVEHPDDVSVERIIDEKGVLLSLTVHPDDLGRVIGKRGITAQSLRTLLRALGTKNDARYNLKIVNTDGGRDEVVISSDDVSTSVNDDVVVEAASDSDEPVEDSTEEDVENQEDESDYTKKSRKELAELDDLDI
ncbi:MAG: KH domain-containing protein [Candidatus Saccharibacteria bacterium]|nr:KH domain-containing protein [Candidatus Saccharibacteria bacterium]